MKFILKRHDKTKQSVFNKTYHNISGITLLFKALNMVEKLEFILILVIV